MPPRVESLTGLRWFAAMGVFCFHSGGFTPMPILNGDVNKYWYFGGFMGLGFSGVTFFFILSGFVLTWSYRLEDTALRFYWRRLARIWPMIPVSTLLAWPAFFMSVPYPWRGLWHTLTLTQAWTSKYFYEGNRTTWSLSCEAFFYLLFPLLIRPALRLSPRMLAVAAVPVLFVITTAPPLFHPHHPRAGSPLYRLPEFLLGIIVAAAMRRGWRPAISFRWAVGLLAAAAAFIWWWFQQPELTKGPSPFWVLERWPWHWPLHKATDLGPHHVIDQVFAPLFALIIATAAARDLDGGKSWLRSPAMVRLGKWSFSFYLVENNVVIGAANYLGQRHPSTLGNIPWFIASVLVSVALAAFCYRWIETPAERWMKKLLPPPKARPTADGLGGGPAGGELASGGPADAGVERAVAGAAVP